MNPGPKLLGAILAGGRSRRFGRDKTLALLGDAPLIAHVVARLRPQVAAAVIVAGSDPGRFGACGLPAIPDTIGGDFGPLVGVLSALDWAARTMPGCRIVLTVPADGPFLPPDLAERLVRARRHPSDIVQAVAGDRPNPLVALWPVALRHALAVACLQEGERSVARFAARYPLRRVELGATDTGLFDIDTPDDLAHAEQMLNAAMMPISKSRHHPQACRAGRDRRFRSCRDGAH